MLKNIKVNNNTITDLDEFGTLEIANMAESNPDFIYSTDLNSNALENYASRVIGGLTKNDSENKNKNFDEETLEKLQQDLKIFDDIKLRGGTVSEDKVNQIIIKYVDILDNASIDKETYISLMDKINDVINLHLSIEVEPTPKTASEEIRDYRTLNLEKLQEELEKDLQNAELKLKQDAAKLNKEIDPEDEEMLRKYEQTLNLDPFATISSVQDIERAERAKSRKTNLN